MHMMKYRSFFFSLLVLLSSITSCGRSSAAREIEDSFKQFLSSIESHDIPAAERIAPFLSSLDGEKRRKILSSFSALAKIHYTVKISRKTDSLYYLKIITKKTNAPFSGVIIPFERKSGGKWEISPVIKAVQYIDIVPARK